MGLRRIKFCGREGLMDVAENTLLIRIVQKGMKVRRATTGIVGSVEIVVAAPYDIVNGVSKDEMKRILYSAKLAVGADAGLAKGNQDDGLS